MAAVGGVPRRLLPQHCVRHDPAAYRSTVAFCVGPRLRVEHDGVRVALKRLVRLPGSKFQLSTLPAPASGEIFFNKLSDVVAWACSARKVLCERGPKAFLSDGVAMAT